MTDNGTGSPWETELAQALDRLSDLGDEAPPNVAAIQMLVLEVQREERRKAARDLLLFLACAAIILSGVIYTLAERPGVFLALQAGALLALAAVAAHGRVANKEVAP